MNQKPTLPGVDPFTFAGFQWPRYIARMACGPAALRKNGRVEQFVASITTRHAQNKPGQDSVFILTTRRTES